MRFFDGATPPRDKSDHALQFVNWFYSHFHCVKISRINSSLKFDISRLALPILMWFSAKILGSSLIFYRENDKRLCLIYRWFPQAFNDSQRTLLLLRQLVKLRVISFSQQTKKCAINSREL